MNKTSPDFTDDIDSDSPQQGSLFEYVEILRRRWLPVLLTFVVVTATGFVYVKTRKKLYVASTSLVVTTQTASKFGSAGGGSGGGEGASLLSTLSALGENRNVETQAAILQSSDLLEAAFHALPPAVQSKGFGIKPGSKGFPRWAIEIEQKKNVDVLTVHVTSYQAEAAANLATSVVQTYLDQDQQRNKKQASLGKDFVAAQMADVKSELEDASLKLAKFAKSTKLVEPISQVQEASKDLIEAKLDLDKAKVAAIAEEKELATLNREIGKISTEIPVAKTLASNPDFLAARSRIGVLQGRLAEQQQIYTYSSPEVSVIRKAIESEEANLRTVAKTIVNSQTVARPPYLDRLIELSGTTLANLVVDKERASGLAIYVAKRELDFQALPDHAREFAELKEQVDLKLKTYESLSGTYFNLLIAEKSTIPNGFVIATAEVPSGPSFPNTTNGAMVSIVGGLIFAIAVALTLERLDSRLRDPATIERITGLTVLTAVPEVKRTQAGSANTLIIGSDESGSGFAESYRLLRNNITFSSPDKSLKTIAVTSAAKGDGKSTTSINLAVACGIDGNRVLLIEADLRRPALHKYLGLSRETGITNVVRGTISLQDAVLPTNFENVSCITSGPLPPSPAEFLNSKSARTAFELAASLYDIVIVDCPPCTGLSDIQVISTFVDGIVLVVALDVTERQYLTGAIRLLRIAKAPVIGMVLNRVRYSKSNYYYYSYYYYYGYYGEDEDKDTKKRGRKG